MPSELWGLDPRQSVIVSHEEAQTDRKWQPCINHFRAFVPLCGRLVVLVAVTVMAPADRTRRRLFRVIDTMLHGR